MANINIAQAVRQLHLGKLIAYPTEGVYGLGCDPFNQTAVQRLLQLKQRPQSAGLILIASDWNQCKRLVNLELVPEDHWQQIQAQWPGPYTWTFPATTGVPGWIRGAHTSVALRLIHHPIANALCQAFGNPIVSTSANLHQQPVMRTANELQKHFPSIDCIDGPLGQLTRATPIHDAMTLQALRR